MELFLEQTIFRACAKIFRAGATIFKADATIFTVRMFNIYVKAMKSSKVFTAHESLQIHVTRLSMSTNFWRKNIVPMDHLLTKCKMNDFSKVCYCKIRNVRDNDKAEYVLAVL